MRRRNASRAHFFAILEWSLVLRREGGMSCVGRPSVVGTCCSCSMWRRLLFCSLSLSVSAPVMNPPVC